MRMFRYKTKENKIMRINIDDIEIPIKILQNPLNEDILQEREKYFLLTHSLFPNIVVNDDNVLIDGYTSYLVAKQQNIKTVECILGDKPKRKKYINRNIKVYNRYHGKCVFCGCDLQIENPNDVLTYMTIDHITPKSVGGKNDISNYQALCKRCNQMKSFLSQAECVKHVLLVASNLTDKNLFETKRGVRNHMPQQIIVNNSVVIDKIKECKGDITRCFVGKLLVGDKRIDVTYDVMSDNLVVAQWYKLGEDYNAREMIMALVHSAFREAVA